MSQPERHLELRRRLHFRSAGARVQRNRFRRQQCRIRGGDGRIVLAVAQIGTSKLPRKNGTRVDLPEDAIVHLVILGIEIRQSRDDLQAIGGCELRFELESRDVRRAGVLREHGHRADAGFEASELNVFPLRQEDGWITRTRWSANSIRVPNS